MPPAPKIKICGITTLEDARFCAGAGADFLGFVQYEKSPRYLPPTDARAIIDWLYGPEAVGVFVNTPPDDVNRAADAAGFAWVQLHGDETPEDCAAVERPVIKALAVSPDDTAATLRARAAAFEGAADLFLLDTRTPAFGGTGQTFDWTAAEDLAGAFPFFLAGGLGPDNVSEAVRRVRPYGIDASSRLESAPGKKDLDLLADFFETLAALPLRAS